MNKIILIGNLTKDPESGSTPNGNTFTRFTLAVNRPFTNDAGERVADYFDIVTWRNLAERCAKYLFKGSKVGINGSVQRRQYEDRNGVKHTTFDVVADEVEFLSRAQQQNGNNNAQTNSANTNPTQQPTRLDGLEPVDPDDLPF